MMPMYISGNALVFALIGVVNGQNCKCIPKDECWPPKSAWINLNQTLDGRLIQSVPPGAVCYPTRPEFDEVACQDTIARWRNADFHAGDPVSVDYVDWAENSCVPIFPNGTSVNGDPNAGENGCTIGNYPAYVVNVSTPADVSSAFQFALQWNLLVNIKSTGHNYLGRSTAYGSLSIWTHFLRGIQYHESFQPEKCPSVDPHRAATVGAGERSMDLYKELDKHGAVAVAGSNPTVGVVGWFSGGGHGPLSSSYGMGADNLLEASVVTPEGFVLTANECQHPDLFYALRGGGGGTYGVVLSATVKAFPSPQTTVALLTVTEANSTNEKNWWTLMAYLQSELPRLKEGGMQGYYSWANPPSVPQSTYFSFFYLFDKPNGTAETLMKPVLAQIDGYDSVIYELTTFSGSFLEIYMATTDATPEEEMGHSGGAMSSRLLSAQALTKNVNHLANVLQRVGQFDAQHPEFGGSVLVGALVANTENKELDIALNPAWRDAVTHLTLVQTGQEISTSREKQALWNYTTFIKSVPLRELDPDSGAYFNEAGAPILTCAFYGIDSVLQANPFEPAWQWSLFGPNYDRLRTIKALYDPASLLWCIGCVGSEEWEKDSDKRLCMVPWAKLSVQKPIKRSVEVTSF